MKYSNDLIWIFNVDGPIHMSFAERNKIKNCNYRMYFVLYILEKKILNESSETYKKRFVLKLSIRSRSLSILSISTNLLVKLKLNKDRFL